MKQWKTLTLGLMAVVAFSLSGCTENPGDSNSSGNSGSDSQGTSLPDYQTGDVIYHEKVVYDTSKEAYNVSMALNSEEKAKAVTCGLTIATASQYSTRNGILTVSGSFMSQLDLGERTLVVTLESGTKVGFELMVVTKIITTAMEFQNINEDLNGIYVLGNDIDLSDIPNFEPLGFFNGETDPNNHYFHGILEGNGYMVKDARVFYASSTDSSEDVYYGDSLFEEEAHQAGNNIGLFQIIGEGGIVRNIHFDNIKVRGRTIVGAIAGIVAGTLENCLLTNSRVQMGTHFYDNDCNMGAVAGSVTATGKIKNVISTLAAGSLSVPNIFKDFSADYIGKIGNGWDHVAEPNNTDPWWQFANVDRPLMRYDSQGKNPVDSGTKEIDSNGTQSNGVYGLVGKTWGQIDDSYCLAYAYTPFEGTSRTINLTQTHKTSIKPASGDVDMGIIVNSGVKTAIELKQSSLYTAYDANVWHIADGSYPSLIAPQIVTTIAE